MPIDTKKGMEKIEHVKAKRLVGVLAADHEIFDRIENKIAANEKSLVDQECRQKFFDFCLTKETELVFSHTGMQSNCIKTNAVMKATRIFVFTSTFQNL